VIEAMTMLDLGISPYSGDIFHETPMIIYVFHFLVDCSELVFMFVDVLTTVILYLATKQLMNYLHERQKREHRLYKVDTSALLLDPRDTSYLPLRVAMAYLLNPYTILTCVARSTCAINNLLIALSLLATLHGSILMMAVFLALATYQSLYPVMLIIPATLHMAQVVKLYVFICVTVLEIYSISFGFSLQLPGYIKDCNTQVQCLRRRLPKSFGLKTAIKGLSLTVKAMPYIFLLQCYHWQSRFESWSRFRLSTLSEPLFCWGSPLCKVMLYSHPFFHMCLQVGLIAVFKSYPSVGDLALFLALLPMWTHLKCYLRNTLLVTCLLVVCSVLFPVLWLWIFSGSANANFYYATTLAFNTGQILLISDYLYAFLRREFHLFHGLRVKSDDGKDSYVLLK
uniref:Phosphatidylinositol glycan anchor biosynthesis, class U n=1 Tax=Petromyzon marinus TaxID=7757 RepID=S4R9F7_PETMA